MFELFSVWGFQWAEHLCPRNILKGFPSGASGKEPACQCRRDKRCGLDPWVRKIPWGRKWQPTPVLLPGKFQGWRSLVGYSPWGRKESDLTECLILCYLKDETENVSEPVLWGAYLQQWSSVRPALELPVECFTKKKKKKKTTSTSHISELLNHRPLYFWRVKEKKNYV